MNERMGKVLNRHSRLAVVGSVGAVVLAGIVVGLAVGDVNPGPTADASPAASGPARSSAPSTPNASPTSASTDEVATPAPPTFTAPDDILPPGSIVVVVTDALQIRAEPGLDARVVFTATAGQRFYVSSFGGPFAEDGLEWYRLGVAGDAVLWGAVGSGTDRYLAPVTPECPADDPILATLLAMLNDWDRLACFGDRPLTITGTYGCGGCGGTDAGTYEPYWLAAPVRADYLWIEWQGGGPFHLHLPPDSAFPFPPEGSIVRTVGHFNDPASADCRISAYDGVNVLAVDPRSAELYCREQFVVDGFEVIGTDPEFP
jgi:hypothetical protein